MKLELGYGESSQFVEIPDKNLMALLESNPMTHEKTGAEAVVCALKKPIGSPRLKDMVKADQKIAIVTSDISRPFPSWDVLPLVLDELYGAGVHKRDITVVFALGSHRLHTEDEKKHLVGERIYQEVCCVDSNAEDCLHFGTTSNGVPVDITRVVAEADFRICLGNIEFHYFAGYSGGAKAIMPGVSTPEAIQANHRLMTAENACAGRLDDNPLRLDIEEAGRLVGIDFIVNAVLDEHKRIVYCVAGNVIDAHRVGCAYLDKMYRKHIEKKADIVIVSQGGAPKDASLYQTQKALDNAKHAVKKGGTIILVGACNEGMGSRKFEQWLTSAHSADSLVERIKEEFELGGHKAAAIGMVLANARIDLISEMDDLFVKSIFLSPQPSVQIAFDQAMKRYGDQASVIVMPFGGATLPVVNEDGGNNLDYASESLQLHYKWKGKIEVTARASVDSKEALSLAYTPGVAQPCLEIQKDVNKSFDLTRRWNTVAVVTDGTAVLGLGDIGPEAGMPVMEGKCVLFKAFGDVDAIPLCIRSKDVDEIVNAVALMAGSFGGINLEDISAPRCFEIERKLKERCDIPIFHDDQHGTAVVTLAGVLNALKLVGKSLSDIKIVTGGAGAAGIAIIRLLISMGAQNVVMTDRQGAIYKDRSGLNAIKMEMADITNHTCEKGSLKEVIRDADVFIGVSAPGTLTKDMVSSMKKDAIIFACANPTPEIYPADAKAAGAAVVSTGRSDFPNQVNNVLAFPGIFRGALDVRASDINDEMKVAAAYAIAGLVSDEELNSEYIIPAAFDERVKSAVAKEVADAAIKSNVAQISF